MKTAILLGAGSSLPAGYPSTQCLTKLVLSGKGVKSHDDGTAQRVNCMVRRIHSEVERYFSYWNERLANFSALKGRLANYEDLFYLARQVYDEVMGEMENPAVHPFIDKLRADMSPLVEAENAENEDPDRTSYPNIPDDFENLFSKTCNYISNIVSHGLRPKLKPTNHLKIFVGACGIGNVTGISTLCHDIHVETHLREEGIALADGFSEKEEEGVRYWDGDFSSNSKTPFLKLHGSVDWFRFLPDCSSPWYDEKIGIRLKAGHNRIKKDGVPRMRPDPIPLLLIGTFNKVADYSQGIFLHLHHRFRATLREADQLVVCGYSFGDKGINTAVIEWYYAKPCRRFVVIHPDRDELVSNARAAIRNKWDEWEDRDAIDFMASRLEKVDVGKFLRKICSPRKYSAPSMNQRRSR